jgi:hypothetical protein
MGQTKRRLTVVARAVVRHADNMKDVSDKSDYFIDFI